MTGSPNLTQHRRHHLTAHPDEPDVPLCSKCGLSNDRAPQRYCSVCHTFYQRSWRRGEIEPRAISRETNVSCEHGDNEHIRHGRAT